MREYDKLWINGQYVPSTGDGTIEVRNPANLELEFTAPDATAEDVDKAVAAARESHQNGPWRRMSPNERADVMGAASAILMGQSNEIADTITRENGSPITFSQMGQTMAAWMVLDYYTNLAREYPFTDIRQGAMAKTAVIGHPVGVVAAIVPWNTPMFVNMLKVGPALAAGCSIVLKPSPETPIDAFMMAEAFAEAGLPPGVLNIVPAGREVGEHLVTHRDINKVSFTGSTAAGKRIMSLCGNNLTRVSLELGGKSAAIFLDDVDLDTAIPSILPFTACGFNNGEACVAQSRILASRERYDEVVEHLTKNVEQLKVGDPLDPGTSVGPVIRESQRDRILGLIQSGVDAGARTTIGGGKPEGFDTGWWIEPTVFADVTNDMQIAQEEIFGPVTVVIPFDDEADAIRIANDSSYGLSGSVWSADTEKAFTMASQIETGTIGVNGFGLDWGAPFGGFKNSGLGRECGREGLELFLEKQTVILPEGFEPSV